MISQNEQEMQRLLEEANRKKSAGRAVKEGRSRGGAPSADTGRNDATIRRTAKGEERLEREEAGKKRNKKKSQLSSGPSKEASRARSVLGLLIRLGQYYLSVYRSSGSLARNRWQQCGRSLPLALQHMIGVNAFTEPHFKRL